MAKTGAIDREKTLKSGVEMAKTGAIRDRKHLRALRARMQRQRELEH